MEFPLLGADGLLVYPTARNDEQQSDLKAEELCDFAGIGVLCAKLIARKDFAQIAKTRKVAKRSNGAL